MYQELRFYCQPYLSIEHQKRAVGATWLDQTTL
jgi:hypothetical protein